MKVWIAICCLFVAILPTQAADFATRFEEIKKTASPQELYTFLFALPKGGDIHNHLGGSCPPEMWYAAATNPKVLAGNSFYARIKIMNCPEAGESLLLYKTIRHSSWLKLSDCEKSEYMPLAELSPELKQKWLDSLRLDKPTEGRDEFFNVIWFRLNELFDDPNVMAELVAENMKQFAAEGLRYLETQFMVDGFTDNDGNALTQGKVIEIVKKRIAQPDVVNFGLTIRFQKTILRFLPNAEKKLEEAYQFVDANRDLWVGINMAGREDNDKGYPLRFLDTFRKMRGKYSNIGLSIHAGEVDEPNHHVRDTLLLGATRIGHGCNLYTDPETMLLMRRNEFLVEINLVSNQLLEYFPDLTKHPFPEYLRMGIPVCLNTDDRGMWDSNMTDEYYTAVTYFNLTWPEIVEMGRNSLVHSFAQPIVKASMVKSYDEAVAKFENQMDNATWQEALKSIRPAFSAYSRKNFPLP